VRRSARWRDGTLERAGIFDLLQGASDGDYNAYNYMVLTARSKPHARGKIPAVIHADGRADSDRAGGGRCPHLRLSEGARPASASRCRSTPPSTVAGPIAQTQAKRSIRCAVPRASTWLLLVASDGVVYAAWHGGNRDSGRFTSGFGMENRADRRLNTLLRLWSRHDLDHLAFVVVRRIGFRPRIGLHRSASHQGNVDNRPSANATA